MTDNDATVFASFLLGAISDAAAASAEIAPLEGRDAIDHRVALRSLQEFAQSLTSEGGAEASYAFAKFFDLCTFHDRFLGGAEAIGLRTRGCQAIAMAGDQIFRVRPATAK